MALMITWLAQLLVDVQGTVSSVDSDRVVARTDCLRCIAPSRAVRLFIRTRQLQTKLAVEADLAQLLGGPTATYAALHCIVLGCHRRRGVATHWTIRRCVVANLPLALITEVAWPKRMGETQAIPRMLEVHDMRWILRRRTEHGASQSPFWHCSWSTRRPLASVME